MKNYLVSYPRSGRAWTLTIANIFRSNLRGGMRHFHSHDKAAVHTLKQYRGDKKHWAEHRVVLTVRNPRDVVVSYWHILRFRTRRGSAVNMDLLQWTQSKEGLSFVVRFLNDWGDAIKANDVPQLMVLTYEDLKASPMATMRRMALGFGVSDESLTPELMQKVVDESTAQKVKDRFPHSNNVGDPRGYSVRRAEADVWHEYYTHPGRRWVDRYVDENLRHFREFYA